MNQEVIKLKKMTKFGMFLNPIKEEKWINNILDEGYKLVSFSTFGFYKFIETDENYVVRVDYRSLKKRDFYDYVTLHEECGWDHISGRPHGVNNQYWEKKKDGNDELFSDNESRLAYYQRIVNLITSVCIIYLATYLSNIFQYQNAFQLFLTPGLWDMPKDLMWKAILFELPFALMRLSFHLIFISLIAIVIVIQFKINKLKQNNL